MTAADAIAAAAGGGADRAGEFGEADFGEFGALQPARRGGERVDPDVRLADALGALDQRGIVERRRLIGHQHERA